jgi:hypothetical protein
MNYRHNELSLLCGLRARTTVLPAIVRTYHPPHLKVDSITMAANVSQKELDIVA